MNGWERLRSWAERHAPLGYIVMGFVIPGMIVALLIPAIWALAAMESKGLAMAVGFGYGFLFAWSTYKDQLKDARDSLAACKKQREAKPRDAF